MATKIQLEDAVNALLNDSAALSEGLTVNLRTAADVQSTTQVNNALAVKANTSMISTREPTVVSGTSSHIWQGDKTWVLKTSLPVSDATQTQLTGLVNSIAATNVNVATLETKKSVKDPTEYTTSLPTLDYDFTDINGAPFNGSLTRATTGGYRLNNRGLLVSTAVNEPVVNFSTGGVAKGTGFYGSYTNLFAYSEQFDHSTWIKSNVPITANSTVGPDGLTNMDRLNSTFSGGYLVQQLGMTSGSTTIYTFSLYIKPGTSNTTVLRLDFHTGGTLNDASVSVNWSTKALIISGNANNKNATLEDIGSGIYRVNISGANSGGTNTGVQAVIIPSGYSATGDIYAWGAQLTQTAFPVPYAPTTSATVTRNADSMIISGTDFTDFFNPVEGTFYAEGTVPSALAAANMIVQLSDSTYANRHAIYVDGGSSDLRCFTISSSVTQAALISSPVALNSNFRIASSYKLNAFAASFNGSTATTDVSGSVPSGLTRLDIGRDHAGASLLNSHIRRIIYWPKALTSTELQNMTL